MKIFGELEKAQFENAASNGDTPNVTGRFFMNTVDSGQPFPMIFKDTWANMLTRKPVMESFTTTGTVLSTTELALADASSGALTLNLAITNVGAVAIVKNFLRIMKTDSTLNKVTIDPNGSDTVHGASTIKLCTPGEYVDLYCSSAGVWIIMNHSYHRKITAYTPTGGWNTNVTFTGTWERRGRCANLRLHIALSGAPNAANCTVNLPTGMTIDTAGFPSTPNTSINKIGYGSALHAGAISALSVRYNNTSSIEVAYDYHNAVANNDVRIATVTATAPYVWANTDVLELDVKDIPITDWLG